MPVMGLSPWLRYKRYSDNEEVSARLVLRPPDRKDKWIEVKEHRVGEFRCPNCKELLGQADTNAFPNFFLEPSVFHEKHRPIQPTA